MLRPARRCRTISHRARWRQPIEFDYRGNRVISMPPPSSGGVTLALVSNLLSGYDLRAFGWHSPQAIHLGAEAMRRAYAVRNEWLGDPEFVPIRKKSCFRMTSRTACGAPSPPARRLLPRRSQVTRGSDGRGPYHASLRRGSSGYPARFCTPKLATFPDTRPHSRVRRQPIED